MRRRIKETAWEKQNRREGFSETFKPLISQFEKPEDSKKENIFTQNQKMLRNQLALTEGLRDNQKAITEGLKDNQKAITRGFEQFERLADMKELPQIENDHDEDTYYDTNDTYYDYFLKEKQSEEEPKKTITFNLEKDFVKEDLDYLDLLGYPRPNDFVKIDPSILIKKYDEVRGYKNNIGHEIGGLKRKKEKTKEVKDLIDENKNIHKMLDKYLSILNIYLDTVRLQKKGEGIMKGGFMYFSPQELIKRFELLGGSLAAGNNGVLHEYIQIAHRLRELGIVTNKQLNTLLRNYVDIR